MTEYARPDGPSSEEVCREWSATKDALPVGTHITGQVTICRPFGVFIRIDGAPNALGMADIGSMPHHVRLPALGAQVSGEVIWHTEHNRQVRIRLSDWNDHL
ncbi:MULTISPECIES: RNA-binding protein [unclassified Streptomyces]|nr:MULTISPECIES: RNA-binding protein [unclassified Streptomyces]